MNRFRANQSVNRKKHRVVLVTGAGSGIGRAVALDFASVGDTVVVTDIDPVAAEETVRLIASLNGTAVAYSLDVASTAQWEEVTAAVCNTIGVPDILVNNAGILISGPFLEQSEAQWQAITNINVLGPAHGSRIVGKKMVERGQGGHIVIVASAGAWVPTGLAASYVTTKAGALMLAEAIRSEFAAHDIGVSAICPGVIRTSLAANGVYAATEATSGGTDFTQSMAKAQAKFSPTGPEAVARAVRRAVKFNLAVLPVTPEAYAIWMARRIAPGTTRRLLALGTSGRAESVLAWLDRRILSRKR